ncbi:MAG: glycogen/starch/alpha-glucan phosphorylase, partial [Desulfobacterales bacterium]|nr:glycogen/starch/alpha-glucan phosphorylase [Desulfobacterales bacterium]
GKHVRMAHLACVGSHAVNGVAALHSELLKQTVLRDFHELDLGKFHNVTNGVIPRRWIVLSNPRLAALISGKIGDSWVSRMESELPRLADWCDDPEFQQQWRQVKRGCKADLSSLIRERTGVAVDPGTLFDIQVKRLHEYKRQHLNLLHIVTLYNRIKKNPGADITPRTFIFGGKAAPGYAMAKLIIELITEVAEVVNRDPDVGARLKVDSLLNRDEYLLLADYACYVDCQDRVGRVFRDQQCWTRMSILNTARSGKFSSDRSIRDYCERIWKVKPGPVPPG